MCGQRCNQVSTETLERSSVLSDSASASYCTEQLVVSSRQICPSGQELLEKGETCLS